MPEPADDPVAPVSRGAWIDQVADRFEAAWQRGREPPQIADFLGDSSGPLRQELLTELVEIDREYRAKHGPGKAWRDYAAEFPDLGPEPPTDSATEDTTDLRSPLETPAREHRGRKQGGSESAAELEDELPPAPLQIGKYQVLKRLGGGGQATAYLAYDPDLSKNVVLKLSHQEVLPGEEDELRSEGRVLAELSHPHLVRVLHYDLFEGRPYLVMEHVAGQNLAQWTATVRPPPEEAALLVAEIAQSLAAAHRRGVIHRDLKPANILIDENGQPRVIDFGLAWHRHGWNESDEKESVTAGTVAFMAPEQARGELERIGRQSDIFGLGGILYFLLTGQAPFMEKGERDFQRVLRRAKTCDYDLTRLQNSGAPPRLIVICRQALAAEPKDRPATADDFAAQLLAFARAGQMARRTLLIAGGAIAGAVGIGGYLLSRRKPIQINAPLLVLRVWRDDKPLPDFSSALPLRGGHDELQLSFTLPPGVTADLYSINGSGKVSSLAESLSGEGQQFFPPAGSRLSITGPTGTEALVLLARTAGSKRPTLPWQTADAWPQLAATTAFRLTPTRRDYFQQRRDLILIPADDPEQAICEQLKKLSSGYFYFEAIVFEHS